MKILDLYITDICNLNCEYCYVDVVKSEETSFNRKDFVSRIDLLSYDSIKFLGGEPLIKWDDIKEIITHVTEKKPEIQFTIITNGILLNSEKISYVSTRENVEIMISLHEGSLAHIRKKKELLQNLGKRISFYIIFDPTDFSASITKFLEFFRYGFKSFCFAPDIYSNWDTKSLENLQKILDILSKTIISHNISIGGVAKNFLKTMNYGCEKYIYNKHGEYKPCNRFRSLEVKENFKYKEVYDYFQDEISYKDDPDRWFYICPVGWFLDNEKDLDRKTKSYKKLNRIFLDFYRYINGENRNFLNPSISEIRYNLTRQCNIRCNYCYVDFKNESLSYADAQNIVDFLLEQPGENKTFSFFGGEPLLEWDLIKKLVGYIHKKNLLTSKNIFFKIATNFLLINEEIINFLNNNDFEIHISINGRTDINDAMRDNSTKRLVKNLKKYGPGIGKNNLVALLAFGPSQVSELSKSIEYVISLGFYRINFELVFGNGIHWNRRDIENAVNKISISLNKSKFEIENIKPAKNIYLDVDTKGRCNDNSLEFYGEQIDRENKQYFDTLLSQILNSKL